VPSERFEALLADYLDGTIDAAGREELAGEVERDPAAARAFEQAVGFEALLVAAHTEPPPESVLAERLGRRAEPAPVLMLAPDRRPAFGRARALAAAAAAILIAAGVWAAVGLFGPGTPVSVPVPPPAPPNVVLAGKVLVDGVESAAAGNGARVEVLGDQPAEIRLADGSNAVLAPKSLAVLHGPVGEVRQVVELTGGKGDFRVEKEPRQFKVETPLGSVTVLGTRFSVELRPGEGEKKGKPSLAVAVTDGTVEVNYAGKPETLAAGASKVFPEEPRKEPPKSGLPDGAVGFAGLLKGAVTAKADRGIDFKVTEVVKTWEASKAADPKVLLGLTVKVTASWVKGEGEKKGHPNELQLRFLKKLEVGQEATLDVKNVERDVFAIAELTKDQLAWVKEGQEPKKENPLPEGARGFAGQLRGTVVKRRDQEIGLKVVEVVKAWETSKAADPKALAGLTIKVTAAWVRVEGGKGHGNELHLAFFRTLEVGREVTLDVRNVEREVFAIGELTKEQAERAKDARKPEGDRKPERKPDGDKKPEPPKSGRDEF